MFPPGLDARKKPSGLTSVLSTLQAHGNPEAAKKEVRALLDLVRANQATVHAAWILFRDVLRQLASCHLTVLDPEHGDEELTKSLAAELVKLEGLALLEFSDRLSREPV